MLEISSLTEMQRTLRLRGFSICPHTIRREDQLFLLAQELDFAFEQTKSYIDRVLHVHQHLYADESILPQLYFLITSALCD